MSDHEEKTQTEENTQIKKNNQIEETIESQEINQIEENSEHDETLENEENGNVFENKEHESTPKPNDNSKDNDSEDREINNDKEDETEHKNVGELMANIFGESSDEEEDENEAAETDEDEPKFLRVENVESDREDYGREWDFDVMMKQKKAERRKRKSKDGSVNLLSDADDLVKAIVDEMTEAANEDRQSNMDKRPAIQKRKMLKVVRSTLLRMDLFEALLDNGMMSAISDWLAPLPDKSLPALELETDFRSLGREDRLARDLAQLPEAKRLKLQYSLKVYTLSFRLDDEGQPKSSTSKSRRNEDSPNDHNEIDDDNAIRGLRPGDPGFINRARVPKPSTKDYVIRPKSQIEGRFQGPSKSSKTSRLAKAQREFIARNKTSKVKRAVGVSIEGRKMDF